MTRFVGIDPSTKTGFIALDEGGIVLKQKELTEALALRTLNGCVL